MKHEFQSLMMAAETADAEEADGTLLASSTTHHLVDKSHVTLGCSTSSFATRSESRLRQSHGIVAFLLLLVATLSSTLYLRSFFFRTGDESESRQNGLADSTVLLYSCPAANDSRIQHAKNDDGFLLESFYGGNPAERHQNLSDYHHRIYDGWDRNFEEIKSDMYHWKSTRFAKYLTSGDSIYESACGEGFNLAMTLEILSESSSSSSEKIDNLIIYGSDYVASSVNVANKLFDQITSKSTSSKKGAFCRGDSTNLFFVPSNSFDLAYTGYIDPLMDALRLFPEKKDYDAKQIAVSDLCSYDEDEDWASWQLSRLDQRAQEEWFAKWVSELLRIVKPGGGVIIEQVAPPICLDSTDWGGVAEDWWADAISEYGWDVDPSSLETEASDDNPIHRYHVSMRKRL